MVITDYFYLAFFLVAQRVSFGWWFLLPVWLSEVLQLAVIMGYIQTQNVGDTQTHTQVVGIFSLACQ